MQKKLYAAIVLTLIFSLTWGARAENAVAGGLKVVSDKNPDASSVDSIIGAIIKPRMTDQQKAEAVFYYLVPRLYHFICPQEPNADGLMDRPANKENVDVMDSVKLLNIYGHAICGSQSWAVNELFNASGLFGRIDGIGGHTVPEVKYGGTWHYFDVDMMGFVRKRDGTVAGVDEIAANKSLLFDKHNKQPDIFFKYDGPEGMWACLDVGIKYSMYGRKVGIHSMCLTLREGESLTRYFKRQWAPNYRFYIPGFKGDYQNQLVAYGPKDGPSRDKTYYLFMENGAARFGNFELKYEPALDRKSALEGAYWQSNILQNAAGLVSAKAGSPSEIVYKFYSPYGCAGYPGSDLRSSADDSNGAILEGEFQGKDGTVAISFDLGKTWEEVHKTGGKFRLDLTPKLETKYCWLVKLGFQGKGTGLKSFKSYISGQLSPASLPFVDGKTQMTFTRENIDCIAIFPDVAEGEEQFKKAAYSMEGLTGYNVNKVSGHASFVRGGVVYKVEAPNDIVRVQAAAKFSGRKGVYEVSFSLDDGKTWIVAVDQPGVDSEEHPEDFWGQSVEGILDFKLKKAYSPGCPPSPGAVRESAFEPKPVKSVLVRFMTKNAGDLCQVYGIYVYYNKPGSLPLKITHEWAGGKYEQLIGANENTKTYTVQGGPRDSNLAIKIEAPLRK